ncbi:MAG: NGG1p interacting factor NIF3 [Oleiphilus sp.]
MYKFSFFVPLAFSDKVKQAVFDAGAGRLGDYAECSWETLGTGQFKPLENSQPFIGKQKHLERVQELKVEMVCEEECIRTVIDAFKQAHPYEEPAYEVIKLERF